MSRCGSCPLYLGIGQESTYKEQCLGNESVESCADHLQSVIFELESENNDLSEKLSIAGVVFSGTNTDGKAIALPCKVGDFIYLANVSHYAIVEGYSMNHGTNFDGLKFHCRCVEHDKSNRKGERAINVCPRCAYGEKCFQGFLLRDFGNIAFHSKEEVPGNG